MALLTSISDSFNYFGNMARRIPRAAWVLLLGIGLSRVAAFAIWPFVAVLLNQAFGLSLSEIGAYLSASLILSSLMAPFSGYLGDRFGNARAMLCACVISMAAFGAMIAAPAATTYILALFGYAIAQSVLEPCVRTQLRGMVNDDESRAFLFHLRYYTVNLAAIIGPLVGAWLMSSHKTLVLALAVAAFGFYALCIVASAPRRQKAPQSAAPALPQAHPFTLLSQLAQNRTLQAAFLANFLVVYIYAQNEDPLVFYLIALSAPDIARIISLFALTNVAVVVLFHLIFMAALVRMKDRAAWLFAFPALAFAQLVFAFTPADFLPGWLLGMALATIAEVIVLPLFTVVVDKIAPDDYRSSFFGLSMLVGVGAGTAPLLGGILIEAIGGQVFFLLLALACVPALLLSRMAFARVHR